MNENKFNREYLGEFPPEIVPLQALAKEYLRQKEEYAATVFTGPGGQPKDVQELTQAHNRWGEIFRELVTQVWDLGFDEDDFQEAIWKEFHEQT